MISPEQIDSTLINRIYEHASNARASLPDNDEASVADRILGELIDDIHARWWSEYKAEEVVRELLELRVDEVLPPCHN